MKTSKITIYIKYQQYIYEFMLRNNWSQCYFGIHNGKIIRVKREIIIE